MSYFADKPNSHDLPPAEDRRQCPTCGQRVRRTDYHLHCKDCLAMWEIDREPTREREND